MNPLYSQMNRPDGLIQRFQQFRNSFKGNPREQVQQLLNSGKVSQQQYDQAVKMADQIRGMLGM